MLNVSINRIRLEFKVHMDYENGRFLIGINRIRLEFKGQQISFQSSYT